jgi:integrase
MRQALDVMAGILTNGRADALTLDWSALRYKHTAALRAALVQRYAPATTNKFLGGLRRVLKEALLLDLLDPQDYQKAIAVKGIKVNNSEPRGRALTREEISALMQVCSCDPSRALGARDVALIAILRGGGLRREEVVNLDLKDLNCTTGALKIRCGKGGKSRTVYLPAGLLALVEDWLSVRGPDKGPVLCHIRKGGRVVVRALTPQSVWFLLEKRAAEAGVEDFSPHDFRRTFISDLLDAGVDLATVQQLAGHADPATTSRYDRRGEETKRRAVQALDIPS